jgi:hypothetical protein
MKYFNFQPIALVALTLTLSGGLALAASDADKTAVAPISKAKHNSATEVNFEDLLVQGKYHFSDEAVTTVEQDKVLDALLGVRTEFKDRLQQSATRF